MKHYDPDDPIWHEDEERSGAYRESYEDWQREIDEAKTLVVTGVARDEGSVVLFATEEGPLVAADHRTAQSLVDALHELGTVEVLAEAWQVI